MISYDILWEFEYATAKTKIIITIELFLQKLHPVKILYLLFITIIREASLS